IQHVTGSPHSPTGQAIVERAHQTLKSLLNKQKGGESRNTPNERLGKALYVLNYLRLASDRQEPPMVIHGSHLCRDNRKADTKILVQYKDLNTGEQKVP
ncbi:POK8 protein, partial [Tricholaema leucomelas]|nr:POK8 protein [Tricholaema leucomelas]